MKKKERKDDDVEEKKNKQEAPKKPSDNDDDQDPPDMPISTPNGMQGKRSSGSRKLTKLSRKRDALTSIEEDEEEPEGYDAQSEGRKSSGTTRKELAAKVKQSQ